MAAQSTHSASACPSHQPDAFGYSEIATRLSSIDLPHVSHDLAEACHRSKALLRTLHYQLENGYDSIRLADVTALVELAMSALPDYESEVFDTIDQFDTDARQTMRKLLLQQQALRAVLNAMESAAKPGAGLEQIREAATTIYDNAALLIDGERHWQAFCALVNGRGFQLLWIDWGNGALPRPEIHTKATLKARRRVEHKQNQYFKAIQDQMAQSSTPDAGN
ncbi:hypothetical protein [Chromobacterium violaceum]|uniref:Uncharacterized protein n=1 Tax=Chromobacterium violaceum TaxID=536 RepID=A0AAX2MGU9_CHRVL|nr:hypothetical protein [Chromobacterium violaceum]STB69187.1 Uncharacterised protein [Chromobacterium violaceum]SUY93550.1 Uncharacterised protein [Chromobacterium violaceum]